MTIGSLSLLKLDHTFDCCHTLSRVGPTLPVGSILMVDGGFEVNAKVPHAAVASLPYQYKNGFNQQLKVMSHLCSADLSFGH